MAQEIPQVMTDNRMFERTHYRLFLDFFSCLLSEILWSSSEIVKTDRGHLAS